jgi:Family of unknown function (DUF5684)
MSLMVIGTGQILRDLWRWRILIGFAILASYSLRAQETLDLLQTDSQTYSNVVVTSKTRTHVSISHARGTATLKIKGLSLEAQRKLGFAVEAAPAPKQSVFASQIKGDPRIKEIQDQVVQVVQGIEAHVRTLDDTAFIQIAAVASVVYLFFCYCCMSICRKAGQKPGLLVWLPIFKAFPLLRAAGMSPWSFLLFLLPVINIIASIVWSVKICRARGKSPWLGLLLLLPVTNILVFLYLALADGLKTEEATTHKVKLSFG